jgi:hypothetical protein
MTFVLNLINRVKVRPIATGLALISLLIPICAQSAEPEDSDAAAAERRFEEFLNSDYLPPAETPNEPSVKTTSYIIKTPHVPAPSPKILQGWVDQLFEGDELWRFKDRETFEAILDTNVFDSSLREDFKALYKETLTLDQYIKSLAHYKLDGPGGYVFVPLQIREKAPRNLLQSVYSSQFQTYKIKPLSTIRSPNLRGIEDFLSSYSLPSSSRAIALNNLVHLNGEYVLLVTPHTWSILPESVRLEMVKKHLEPDSERTGINARLVVHRNDNLSAIAKKYAGERDPRPIEQTLRLALGESESAEIPLESIMHPFIQKMINTYAECHGPNCYNSGLNVNRGPAYRIENVEDGYSLIREAYTKYRYVKPSEWLQAGDLLAYANAGGRIVHVASYEGDGLVITKNGLSKFQPWIRQELSEMEKLYFSDEKYQLMVFRIPKFPELPIAAHVTVYPQKVIYRELAVAPMLHFEDVDNCLLPTLNSKLESDIVPTLPKGQ